MSIFDALRVSIRAIGANGLRSFLTTLGMVIGVGSVIVLIAVGQGAQKGVTDQIRGLGQDLMFIRPGQAMATGAQARGAQGSAQTLTKADGEAIQEARITGIESVAPQVSFEIQVINGANNAAVTLIGTTQDYPQTRASTVADGDFLSATDIDRNALTVILGADVAKQLFPEGGAVGETVRVSFAGGRINLNFRVAGVMAPKGASGGGGQDQYVYVPVTTMQARLGFVRNASGAVFVNQINVKLAAGADKKAVAAAITQLLQNRHAVASPDFSIQTQDDLVGAASEVSRTLSILLGSIAGISLIVGGIGVMNIMLVSVTERTREIGIRRAVGARRKDVVTQFVTEALTLCIGGGLLGIAVGVGAAVGINGREIGGNDMATVIQPWSIVVAFAVAAGIGAASGSYPAFRASRLDPIVALRNE